MGFFTGPPLLRAIAYRRPTRVTSRATLSHPGAPDHARLAQAPSRERSAPDRPRLGAPVRDAPQAVPGSRGAEVVQAYALDHVGRTTGVDAVPAVGELNVPGPICQRRRSAIGEPAREGSCQANPDATVHLPIRADHDARSPRGAEARVVDEISDEASPRVAPVGRRRARPAVARPRLHSDSRCARRVERLEDRRLGPCASGGWRGGRADHGQECYGDETSRQAAHNAILRCARACSLASHPRG